MVLEINELEELLDEIRKKVILANRTGELEELLLKWELTDLINPESDYDFETFKDGKIVVLGGCEVKKEILLAICREAGIDKNRLEFNLDYNALQKYETGKLLYNPNYRVVLVGAMPHSGIGKNDSNSIITEMENKKGYPRIVRLTAGSELKITKNSFKNAVSSLIAENYI